MPTLALPPQPPSYAHVASAEELIGSESPGNGAEADQLSRLGNEALAHWLESAQGFMWFVESDDEVVYEHLLPSPDFIVKVHYRAVGKLEPRSFRIDD